MSDIDKVQEYKFEVEVFQVLSLVINLFYFNKEIFLCEFVLNVVDVIDKVCFCVIVEKELLGGDIDFCICVSVDEDVCIIIIDDNGVGMMCEEFVENFGIIVYLGLCVFIEQFKVMQDVVESGQDVLFIGQFGVGFYSLFLIVDEVEVIMCVVGVDEVWCWKSNVGDGYIIEVVDCVG